MKPLQDLPSLDGPVFLTTKALADYLGYTGKFAVDSAQRFVARHGIRKHYRSAHCVLVRRADVDHVLATGTRQQDPPPHRRRLPH